TRAACLEEAVLALVDCFADTSLAAAPQPVPVTLDAAPDPDLLVTLLEEVIYTTEVLGVVPVTVELADTDDGGVAGSFEAVPVEAVEITGSPPKGVSHQVTFDRDRATWRCQVLIDV
ncbi:MAG TPA: archease, partial [Acidimicrobiia bacterium]|nr:archease [Acidimicrobiia bacterium]